MKIMIESQAAQSAAAKTAARRASRCLMRVQLCAKCSRYERCAFFNVVGLPLLHHAAARSAASPPARSAAAKTAVRPGVLRLMHLPEHTKRYGVLR